MFVMSSVICESLRPVTVTDKVQQCKLSQSKTVDCAAGLMEMGWCMHAASRMARCPTATGSCRQTGSSASANWASLSTSG